MAPPPPDASSAGLSSRLGVGGFNLGKLLALATIPVSLSVFAWQLLPVVMRHTVLRTAG